MLAGDGDVIQEDIRVGVAPGRGHVLVQQETCPGVRAGVRDQQGRTGRQRRDGGALVRAELRLDGRGIEIGGRLIDVVSSALKPR